MAITSSTLWWSRSSRLVLSCILSWKGFHRISMMYTINVSVFYWLTRNSCCVFSLFLSHSLALRRWLHSFSLMWGCWLSGCDFSLCEREEGWGKQYGTCISPHSLAEALCTYGWATHAYMMYLFVHSMWICVLHVVQFRNSNTWDLREETQWFGSNVEKHWDV